MTCLFPIKVKRKGDMGQRSASKKGVTGDCQDSATHDHLLSDICSAYVTLHVLSSSLAQSNGGKDEGRDRPIWSVTNLSSGSEVGDTSELFSCSWVSAANVLAKGKRFKTTEKSTDGSSGATPGLLISRNCTTHMSHEDRNFELPGSAIIKLALRYTAQGKKSRCRYRSGFPDPR